MIAALGAITVTHSLAGLYALSFLIGCLATAAQVSLPMAAALADREHKGKIVSIVYTGIIVGILGARIFSGYIAEWLTWRHVYGISGCMTAVATLMVAFMLPKVEPTYSGNYAGLLTSTLAQLRRFALLRRLSTLAVFTFGTFFAFWTTLTFHLSGAPFHYHSDIIGMFGVAGIAGALAAPVFGRMADKMNPAKNQLFSVGLMVVGIALLQVFPYSLGAFIATTVLLDLGHQATQVTNLAQIYTLDESAHSRINTMIMTISFIGGALGTWVGVKCWTHGGWNLVGWQMQLWACMAMAVAVWGYRVSLRKK